MTQHAKLLVCSADTKASFSVRRENSMETILLHQPRPEDAFVLRFFFYSVRKVAPPEYTMWDVPEIANNARSLHCQYVPMRHRCLVLLAALDGGPKSL